MEKNIISIFHLHIHIIPRYMNDVPNPKGGIRNIFNNGDYSIYVRKNEKLVRDNIPNIIEQQGDKPDFVILDSFDYYNELKKKLTEEVTEFTNSDDVIELCDLIEVISAILDYKNINNKEFEEMRSKKNKSNGKFKNKIFLNGVHRMS